MSTCIDKQPIFVVGVPRSGTTLLAAMLAAHSRLSCGPETRFFHFLGKTDPGQLCEAQLWPEKAVGFLFSTKLVDIPVPKHYSLTREQIYAYLKERPTTVPVILSSLTEQYMYREGKCRWVEKSPEHLMYIHDIRRYFPQSPIIRIMRDPRDVALSLVKAPWAPPNFLEALMFWRKYDEHSAMFFQQDHNCYTIYYENLVAATERELGRLCSFIGEEYEHQMLDTSKSASKVVAEKEIWHRIVHKPVDKKRIQVWKKELPKEQNRLAEALIGDRLLTYGYQCDERFECIASVYPSLDSLLQYRIALASFVDQEVRFWRTDHNEKIQFSIYVGEPDRDRWLRYGKPGRWWDTFRIIVKILVEKVTHKRIFWLRDRVSGARSGYCSRVIAFVLQLTWGDRLPQPAADATAEKARFTENWNGFSKS